MSNENKNGVQETEAKARRDFLKNAGKAAVVAPAVALLLSASAKPAMAQPNYLPEG